MDKSAKKAPYSNTPRQEKAKKVKDTDTPKQQKPKNGPKKKLYTQQIDGPQILDGSESQVVKSDFNFQWTGVISGSCNPCRLEDGTPARHKKE